MKRAMIIWNLVFVISIGTVFGLVSKKHRKPRHDEIERVINETHSVIWKCKKHAECNPGLGLNVHCGTSIPFSMPIKCVPCVKGANFSDTMDYSTCKSCRNCGKYEEKSGECTPEEDTTTCLGTCQKGFYMDEITGGCHPCSDCCGQYEKYHEKQCENSGLPSKTQCRQNNCHQPTKENPTTPDNDKPESLSHSEIGGIVVGIIGVLVIVVAVILFACYGWQQIKSTLKSLCCCCCHLLISNAENTVRFEGSESQPQGSEYDQELATGKSGHHFPATPKGTSKSLKKLVYERMQSVPVESKQEPINRKKFPRSHSHPGALNKSQETSNANIKGYIPVPTSEPSDVDNIPESSLKPVHVVVQQPNMLSPIPVAEEVPAVNHVPQNSSQSVDAMVQKPTKQERLKKPSVKSQHTSTTGLHLSSTTMQLDGIPDDFQKSLLSKQMSDIPIKFYKKICVKLNIQRSLSFDDYRLLGEEIGLTKDETSWLGHQSKNPTNEIIQIFNSQEGSCVGKFKAILEEMERSDVLDVIAEWFKDEWSIYCNSLAAGPRSQTLV